ncbi:MAG TPA: threonine synthase, partial [Cyclobacteriaceae bacterium]|nr:threonine synthase [Cyclobacteriaceae bacterium]
MKFYSTNNRNHVVDLREAVIQGLAPDNGLYMPETIPQLLDSVIKKLPTLTFKEIGYEVAKNLIGNDLPDQELHKLIDH